MAASPNEGDYLQVAEVLELLLGTLVISTSSVVLTGYSKVCSWRKPYGILIMNLLFTDVINGIIGILHAVYIMTSWGVKDVFTTIFFLQALFLWVSLINLVLLNLSRLVGIVAPFSYNSLFTVERTWGAVLVMWATGFIHCFITKYAPFASRYGFYSFKVLFHILLNVTILALAITTLVLLKRDKENQCETRRRATKTVAVVSVAYFLSYGYYCYVYIVWMIPGLPNSTNPWLRFTAVDKSSLSLAHLFLISGSMFNGILLGLQPSILAAIRNIHVPNYQKELERRTQLNVVCSGDKAGRCPDNHRDKPYSTRSKSREMDIRS